MTNIILHEGQIRGFLSNYICLLASYKRFSHVDPNTIFIGSDNFRAYGSNPRHWFDISNISDGVSSDIHWDTGMSNEIEECPKPTQFSGLLEYQKYVPYNSRVTSYLETNKKPLTSCLGVHYRGTDHGAGVIPIDSMLASIGRQLETGEYEQIFLCSDQEGLLDFIRNKIYEIYKFDNFIVNDTFKSNCASAVFFLPVGLDVKIALGDQVLLDTHMLSECKYVLGKPSNIINYARILNNNLEGYYIDLQKDFL